MSRTNYAIFPNTIDICIDVLAISLLSRLRKYIDFNRPFTIIFLRSPPLSTSHVFILATNRFTAIMQWALRLQFNERERETPTPCLHRIHWDQSSRIGHPVRLLNRYILEFRFFRWSIWLEIRVRARIGRCARSHVCLERITQDRRKAESVDTWK